MLNKLLFLLWPQLAATNNFATKGYVRRRNGKITEYCLRQCTLGRGDHLGQVLWRTV